MTDERPVFRDRIPKEDFASALGKNDITNQFIEQIRRLFDAMGKYGIEYYRETKEKKEIEQEDLKKLAHDEKVRQIAERIEICKTVARVQNKKQQKKAKEEQQQEEIVEEVVEEIIEMPDNEDQEEIIEYVEN